MDLGPQNPKQWICREWVGKLGFSELDNNKVDLDDKRMKIDKFKLKKIILGTVQGDQFLYIDS